MGDIAIREAAPLTVADIRTQVNHIQEVMKSVMHAGEHYGVVPGTGTKPTLLKAGAEKLGVVFRLAPTFKITRTDLENDHREYEVVCTLTHITTGAVFGEGVGSCSTKESKYRWRESQRTCPTCGAAAIIKGKAEYGGGWICFTKKGGCGAKFEENDPAIVEQKIGRAENPDIADVYNTVLKMAKKRAHVDATLTAVGASDIFTQDIEDMPEHAVARQAAPEPAAAKTVPPGNPPAALSRADLLKRAGAAVDSGMFKQGEVDMYRTECMQTRNPHKLKELVEEMERAVQVRKAGLDNPDVTSDAEPELPDAQSDAEPVDEKAERAKAEAQAEELF